jgi:hypothetical protein
MRTRILAFVLAACWPASAQRDFLRPDEVELVREAQEPDVRLPLYVKFARERLRMVEQMLAKERPGRGALIRQTLEEYTRIIEAMDAVSEDALRRGWPAAKGISAMASAEKEFLAALEKLAKTDAPDLPVYRFALEEAILATRDSLEIAGEDLSARESEARAREERERKEREAQMRPEEIEARRAAEKKEEEQKKKVPTLRRPGETVPPKK